MGDNTAASIISALVLALPMIATFILTIRNGWKTEAVEKKLDINTAKTVAVEQTMSVLERNTNSMKDALVASTEKAGLLQGHAAGLADAAAAATTAIDSSIPARLDRLELVAAENVRRIGALVADIGTHSSSEAERAARIEELLAKIAGGNAGQPLYFGSKR